MVNELMSQKHGKREPLMGGTAAHMNTVVQPWWKMLILLLYSRDIALYLAPHCLPTYWLEPLLFLTGSSTSSVAWINVLSFDQSCLCRMLYRLLTFNANWKRVMDSFYSSAHTVSENFPQFFDQEIRSHTTPFTDSSHLTLANLRSLHTFLRIFTSLLLLLLISHIHATPKFHILIKVPSSAVEVEKITDCILEHLGTRVSGGGVGDLGGYGWGFAWSV